MKFDAMPIMLPDTGPPGPPTPASLPWPVIQPHAVQAWKNHSQTLERLAERGGLSPSEAVAILEDRRWRPMSDADAFNRLAQLVREAWP